MSRIIDLFNQNKKVLSFFFTAGFPKLGILKETILELEKKGVNMIEIGIPFSDPIADGPIIQESSQIALKNGMNIDIMFKELKDIRKHTNSTLLIMGYYNQIITYGVEKFLKKCNKIGIDGTIIPDLPVYEYKKLKRLFIKYKIINIFFLTNQTTKKRENQILKIAKGFVYVMSSNSTTGNNINFNKKNKTFFNSVVKKKPELPKCLGFGVINNNNFELAKKYFDGVIVGSLFIKSIKEENNIKKAISKTINILSNRY